MITTFQESCTNIYVLDSFSFIGWWIHIQKWLTLLYMCLSCFLLNFINLVSSTLSSFFLLVDLNKKHQLFFFMSLHFLVYIQSIIHKSCLCNILHCCLVWSIILLFFFCCFVDEISNKTHKFSANIQFVGIVFCFFRKIWIVFLITSMEMNIFRSNFVVIQKA